MRIAIVGAGAVGGYFGARLAHAGQDVTFIARGAHLDAIRARGLQVVSPALGDFTVTARAEAHTAAVGPVDLVVFAVKAYDNDTAIPQLAPLVGSDTAVLTLAPVTAQTPAPRDTDLDRFMAAVLARRDDNWKKLQQYILDERERVQVLGPGGARLYGLVHDYRWFVKDGYFVRSPLAANGVAVSEEIRRKEESEWLLREQRREQRRTEREREKAKEAGELLPADAEPAPAALGDVLRQQSEPSFVRAAYFLRFRFEAGRYALAGKETLGGRELLRVEYYPARLFDDEADGKTRAERRAEQARRKHDDHDEERIERQMNKASLVTLWILRNERQIVRYVFDNVDWGFLPGRSVVRVDDVKASMAMGEAFPGIWLPRQVEARMAFVTAVGNVEALYDITYTDYKEAGVSVRVR